MVSVLDSYFGGRGFEPQPNQLLCWFYFIFYWWIVFVELFRYILKRILNNYIKFEEICLGSCFPRNYLKSDSKWCIHLVEVSIYIWRKLTGVCRTDSSTKMANGSHIHYIPLVLIYFNDLKISCFKIVLCSGSNDQRYIVYALSVYCSRSAVILSSLSLWKRFDRRRDLIFGINSQKSTNNKGSMTLWLLL